MKKWTIIEIEWIKANCAKFTKKEMAKHLGVKESQVAGAMKNRGITSGRDGRFPKGNVPFNKGTKGLMKPNATSFGQGHRPHNELEGIGHISIRYHKREERSRKMIKIATGRWKLLSRHVWEQSHGAIPKGMLIRQIDGDTMNCDLSNLDLISKADNVIMNTNRKKQSESMKSLWGKTKRMKRYGVHINGLSKMAKNLY